MRLILLAATAACAATAATAGPVRLIVGDVAATPGAERIEVELIGVNGGPEAILFVAPASVTASVTLADGGTRAVVLVPVNGAERRTIGASGFGSFRYAGRLASGLPAVAGVRVTDASLAALDVPNTRVAMGNGPAVEGSAAGVPASTPSSPPAAPPSAGAARDNPFLANLSAYEPMYVVYGPGTDTSARIQISLKYQLLGRRGNWLDGITFAYTQRMFWDIERASSPFRDVNYMPELFYLVAPRPVGDGAVTIGGRLGVRHESNGRAGAASRSINTAYVQPEATMPLGGAALTLGPRLWTYVGDRGDNPDIARYRGRTGLYAALGKDDGLRLSLTSRLNIGSGKGAVDAVLSYPLTRIWAAGPQLYLIAQGFQGYGESLLDYRVRQTRVRLGFGITR